MQYFVFGYEGEDSNPTPVNDLAEKKFSQLDLNNADKKERERRQAAEAELKAQKELIDQLRNQHSMTQAEKDELTAKIDEYEKAKMTEKERLDHEMAKVRKTAEEKEKALSTQLSEVTRSRDNLIITRAIKEAAMEGKIVAADGTGHQVHAVLSHSASVNEEGEVIIKGFEYTEDGKTFTADLPVAEAIDKMKSMNDRWGNFWKDPSIKGVVNPFQSNGSSVPGKDPSDFKAYQRAHREGKLSHQRGK